MLDRGPNEIYAIDTVNKAIQFRIALYGGHTPKLFSPENLVNACINYFYNGALSLSPQEVSRVRTTTPQRFSDGIRAEFDVAPKGGSCIIDLIAKGAGVNQWLFHETYLGTREFAGPTAAPLSYWYLFPPATPIVAIPSN
jgi:hypothetical protein